jgi:hypothetical protein
MEFPKWAKPDFKDGWNELDSLVMKSQKLVESDSCKLRLNLYNQLSTISDSDAKR